MPASILVVADTNEKFTVDVEYTWHPVKCSECLSFGHSVGKCPTSPKIVKIDKVEHKGATKADNQYGGRFDYNHGKGRDNYYKEQRYGHVSISAEGGNRNNQWVLPNPKKTCKPYNMETNEMSSFCYLDAVC
ncbi:hypothetical protein GIB67_023656 [Kingdonia uniflora]|uniref:Uncharacterized protein n=1 Tax=Kingdonia uniflora TaxID=39325 RepID=A0A7J7NTA8_9MAGN|nr:hypothetical protein GIB67_023656 [Kingdonia uniflora]